MDRTEMQRNGVPSPVPETELPANPMKKTTTISTIAVQSGKTRLVIALLHCGDWVQLKILEVTPSLTALGNTLSEALDLQKAHDDVLKQLQNKQSPVEELLRQADQLISTQKPRAEVYAAMAESLGRAWNDVNAHLELRKTILDLNVQYHTRAQEFFERMDALEEACSDTLIPIEIDAVKNFLTSIHDLRRSVLEALMGALQAGNSLIGKLKELGAQGTLDSRPDRIRSSVNRAISQVQEWMDQLHLRRQVLEATFTKRKTQLEQCLALAILAADLRDLEYAVQQRRELLHNSDQLGDSSSSAELLQHELKKLIPEANQLQERALKITKATEQLLQSGCFAGEQATDQAYSILSSASEYLNDLQQRDSLFDRVIAFFRSAQTALTNLDQLEIQLKMTELSSTSPQLAQLHANCAKTIEEITSHPITEGYSILDVAGRGLNAAGVQRMVEELENRKIALDSRCVAHKEENKRVNQALNTFLEKQGDLYAWLVGIAEAFLQSHQDMGSNLLMAKDFLDLHNHLLTDLQTKGNEINTLLLTLPPILEYLEDHQRKVVDDKVEALHERWIKLKNILESRLDLGLIYVKFFTDADRVASEMDVMEQTIQAGGTNISDEMAHHLEEKMDTIIPLYQSAKNTGLTFINETHKVSEPYLDTKRACVNVESVLERLAGRQLTVNRNWQTFHTEIVEKRELRVLHETTMVESTQTINWVSKLDTQLYPVITTSATNPIDIQNHIKQKLETVLPEIKRAQCEVEQRIQTTEALMAKSAKQPDRGTLDVKNKLSEMNRRLIHISTDYQVLLQMMISYFDNLAELDETTEIFNQQFDNMHLPDNLAELEVMISEHDASKQAVLEMFRFTELIIHTHEPSEFASQDIEKMQHILQSRKDKWEHEWRQRRDKYEGHRSLCQFDMDLQQINETLNDLSLQLSGVKGQYGESLNSARDTSSAFVYFEKTIELIEKRINDFVATGELLQREHNVNAPHINHHISDLIERWHVFKQQVADTRRLINLSIQYFHLVDEADEWFREGSRLLVSIARKSTTVKRPEEAQVLLNEIEIFLKPGETKQGDRIKEITHMASILFGIKSHEVNNVLIENQDMLESFSVISAELKTLANNLRLAEEQRIQMLREQEEANLQLEIERENAAREEARIIAEERIAAENAARAYREAEQARKAAEEQRIAAENEARILREAEEARKAAEKQRIAAENEARILREAEEARKAAEKQRIAAENEMILREAEEARRAAEEQRIAAENEARVLREAEDARKAAEEQRLAAENEARILREAEEARKAAEEQRLAEENQARLLREAEEARKAAENQARVIREAEEARQVEQERQRQEEEAKKIAIAAEEAKIAAIAVEEAIKAAAEQARLAELAVAQEEARKAEECAAKLIKETTIIHKIELTQELLREKSPEGVQIVEMSEESLASEPEIDEEMEPEAVEESPKLEAPHFVSPLSDQIIQEGSKFTFICHVTGLPVPVVTWHKDSISIQNNPDYLTTFDQGLCSLSIEETFAEDSARYTCKATNAAGIAETGAFLSVKENEPEEQLIPPVFVKNLQPASVKVGEPFQFHCKVEGNPLPTVQWFKNIDCIDNSPDYLSTYNNGVAILKFEQILLEDKADYTCKACNEVGVAQSTANLSVIPLEPSESPAFITPLSNVMARAGQKIKLECEFSGLPPPNLLWSHNGKLVKETRELKLHRDTQKATLIIHEAFPKDAGTYSITATNLAGEVSSTCSVSVKGRLPAETSDSELASDMEPIKPSIQVPLKDVCINEGNRVRLDCVIVGQPEPEVIWYHDGRPVKESPDFQLLFQGDRCSLIIQEALLEDAGLYKVVALNSAGEASSQSMLSVTAAKSIEKDAKPEEEKLEVTGTAPRFSKLLSDILVSEGDKVVLEASVSGDPCPDVKWYLNNIPIDVSEHVKISHDADGNLKLEIENIKPEDRGVYTVKACNPSGDAKCFAQLIVKSLRTIEATKVHEEIKSAPVFKEAFADRSVFENTPTKFECIVIGKPTPKVRWFFNDVPVAGKNFLISTSGDRQVLSIPEVMDGGKITCIADNECGKATCDATLSVQQAHHITLPEMERQIEISQLPDFSKDIQQHTESNYTFKREVQVKSATSTTSKIISSSSDAPQPHIEEHKFSSQDEKSFKQINQEAPQVKESHRQEEYHKIGDQQPVTHEKTTSLMTIGGKETIEPAPIPLMPSLSRTFKSRPPKFMTPVIGKIVDQDSNVVLEGILDGSPTPEVSWTKNNADFVGGDNVKITYQHNCARIELKNVSISDAGRYSCTASNPAGKAISTADLVVRKTVFPPVFGRRLQAQVIKKGDRVNMDVEVTGTPEPEVTWFKDGIPLKDALKDHYKLKTQGICHTLVLEKAELSHTGKYTVRALNDGGEAQSIADIAVFEPTPDTMIEVVKTVVFEDVRKHETLTSAADKSSETITSGPVEVFKPIPVPVTIPSMHSSSDSQYCKTEITSHTENIIKHDTKTFTLGRTTPVPDFEMPKKIKPIETVIDTQPISEPEIIDEGIQTSSITKQQSLDFFVKKMKAGEEPIKIKEAPKSTPISKDLYTKFEEISQEKSYTEVPKMEPYVAPIFEPLPILEPYPTPIYKPMESQQFSSYSSSQSQLYEEFNLTPEPPPEICFVAKQETTVKTREDVTEKIKRLEESHKDLSFSEIPSGGVKIFPSLTKPKETPKPAAPMYKPVPEIPPFEPLKIEPMPQIYETFNMPEQTQIYEQKYSSESSKHEYYKSESSAPIYMQPSTEGLQMEKLWTKPIEFDRPVSAVSSHSFEKQTFTRPFSAMSNISMEQSGPSAEGIAMEKSWAHKLTETNVQKAWPPQQIEVSTVKPSWSTQTTLEKKWAPSTTETIIKETKTPTTQENYYKEETKTSTPNMQASFLKESKFMSETIVPPLDVPHYLAQVSHSSNIKQEQMSSSYSSEIKSEMHKEYISEEHNARPSEIIKSWPPKQKEIEDIPIYKPVAPYIESLPIRPISVQDITNEVYLEPGSPPEMGYAEPPKRRVSYVETIEQDLEQNIVRGPSKVLPGGVRTMPPPLPVRREQPIAPPVPPKPCTKPVEPPKQKLFEKFPELEPFPFKAEIGTPKLMRVGPPPTPSKFIKGRFVDSDYESDFEAIRITPRWKPHASDTDEPAFRHVNPPRFTTLPRSRSSEKEALPPSKFEQPGQIQGTPRPTINFEACKQIRKETQIKKQIGHFTKSHEVKKISPPLIKPGSPPIYVEPKLVKPQSPKTKQKMSIDGYMADTDEPFIQQQKKQMKCESFKHEEKTEFKQMYQSSSTSQSTQFIESQQKFPVQIQKPITAPKFSHHKKHVSSSTSSKKKLVSTPIITSVSSNERVETKHEVLEPFPYKPDPPAPKMKLPPPPSPSRFVKTEFRESDYESDYEGRIPPVWRSDQSKYYKPVRPVLTPTMQSQHRERTPTPPTEFDNPNQVPMPSRPKFEPIEKPKKTVKLEQIIKPVPKPTPIVRPTPIVKPVPITDFIIATPAIPGKVILLQPGSPPEMAFAPSPKQTQYYRSTTSAPYHNAVQTETSNVMHFNESTEHSHRTVSMQSTTKVIKFGDQKTKQELQPFPYKTEPERIRRSSAPPPPKPKKFTASEFRESDYESEIESARIKSKWAPGYSDSEEPHFRPVRAPPLIRASSVPAAPKQVVPTPMDYDTHPPYKPQYTVDHTRHVTNLSKRFGESKSSHFNNIHPGTPPEYGYAPQKITKSTATTMAAHHMDNMTNTFKSKAQQFVTDIMDDVSKKQTVQKPILKSKDDTDAQVYREETRAAQYGTKHVDPDTGLIYFKYDFGYEFGIILPGESKNGEIPIPKKTIIQPPQRSTSIDMPVYHEKSHTNTNSVTPQFQPKKFHTSSNKNVKWEPTSESEMSEYEGDGKKRNRWEQSSCSPVSLSPSIPSTSPAFNNHPGSGMKGTETPPSCPSTPGMLSSLNKRAPMFITPLRDIAAVSGQTARFECIVQSEPAPSILWSKNGRIIENSNDYQLFFRNGVCRLTIPRAYPEDAGSYICTATNQIGAVGTTASLQVPGERRSSYM